MDVESCGRPGCKEKCWAHDKESDEPCWGQMNVTETHPDCWEHFCDGHGTIEDYYDGGYKPESKEGAEDG